MRVASGEVCDGRTYYVCMAGGAMHPCATITASAHWTRLHGDIFATGQKYDYVACGFRDKVNFGLIVELILRGEVYYVKAPFPDPHIEDLKAMGGQIDALGRYHSRRAPGGG